MFLRAWSSPVAGGAGGGAVAAGVAAGVGVATFVPGATGAFLGIMKYDANMWYT